MNSKKTKFRLKDEHGAVTIIAAILISIMLGFTALSIDAGMAYHNKAKLQNATDSVALAIVNTVGVSADSVIKPPTNGANPLPSLLPSSVIGPAKDEIQTYFEENGIHDFKNDDTNSIELYHIDAKIEVLNRYKNEKNKTVVFYDTVSSQKDKPGYSYVEVYAKKHSRTIFGNILDVPYLSMSAKSAAKCDVILSGNPGVLNYQVVNISPEQDKGFTITGPLEKTMLKSILNIVEKVTNAGLDILQNETFLIKYLMGGPTRFSCPTCGYDAPESEFINHGPDNATVKYLCPQCLSRGVRTECSAEENSNKVATNIITSSAVLNGSIHTNGYANIDIDTIRMRNWQMPEAVFVTCETCNYTGSKADFNYKDNGDGTAYYKCPKCSTEHTVKKEDGYKIEDNYVIYDNGTTYSIFPRLQADSFDSLKISGSSANDVFLIGNPIQGANPPKWPTIRKSGIDDQAKLWDRDIRTNKFERQFTYKTTDKEHNKNILLEPGERDQLLSYMNAPIYERKNSLGLPNIGTATKAESGSSYTVEFAHTLENGNTWAFTPNRSELTISAKEGANGILEGCTATAPWLDTNETYRDRITTIKINKGIKKIDKGAFAGLPNLKKVMLPDTLVEIDANAFDNCPKLTEIIIPTSVTKIDNNAFANTLTTVKGIAGAAEGSDGKPSESQRYAKSVGKKFVSDEDAVKNGTLTQNTKYNKVLDPNSILNETDIGNNRVLPDAYTAFDNEHEFDFDFDGKTDSIRDLTSGKFTVTEYIKNVGKDKNGNSHFDISDEESNTYDNARIILDKIVTSYTGDIHDVGVLGPYRPNDSSYKKAFKKLFDINVLKAINTVDGEIENTLDTLNTALNEATNNYFTPDATPVEDYYEKIKPVKPAIEKPASPILPNYNDITLNKLATNKVIGTKEKAKVVFDQLKAKDPNLVNNIITELDCKNWTQKNATVDKKNEKTYYSGLNPGEKVKFYNNVHKTDCVEAYKDGRWKSNHFEVPSKAMIYVNGYCKIDHSNDFWGTHLMRDLVLKAGTPENPTVLIINAKNKFTDGEKGSDGKDIPYALKASGSIKLEDNTILIVNGNMKMDGAWFQMGNNSHIICTGMIQITDWGVPGKSVFLGTGNSGSEGLGFGNAGHTPVDNWTLVADSILFKNTEERYCGINYNCLMLVNDINIPNTKLLNRGILYNNNNSNINRFETAADYSSQSGVGNFESKTYVNNNLNVTGDLNVSGSFCVNNNLTGNNVNINSGSGYIGNDLLAKANANIKTDAYVNHNFTSNGTSNLAGSVYVGNDYTGQNTSTFGKLVYIQNNLTNSGNVTFNNETYVGNNYSCSAYTTFSGTTVIDGDTTTSGGAKVVKSLYTGGNFATGGTTELNGVTYVGKVLSSTGEYVCKGNVIVEQAIKSGTNLYVNSGVTLVKGIMRASDDTIVTDKALATSYDTGIDVQYIEINNNARLIDRGPVNIKTSLVLGRPENTDPDAKPEDTPKDTTRAVIYVDGEKTNATNNIALNINRYVNFYNRANMYVLGDVSVNASERLDNYNGQGADKWYSFVMATDAYAGITGNLKTYSHINLKAKALLNVYKDITVGGDIRVGTVSNDPAEVVNTKLTGVKANNLIFTNPDPHTAILHCYNGSIHAKGNINPKIIGIDDHANVFVGGDIGTKDQKLTYIKCWDWGKLFVRGSIYSAGQVGTLNDAESACQVFVGKNLVADGGVFADYTSDVLVNGKIEIANADMRVGNRGSIFGRDGITYKAGTIEVEYILYSDGKIINKAPLDTTKEVNINAAAPDYVQAANRLEKNVVGNPTAFPILAGSVNIIRIVPKEPANSVNLSGTLGDPKNPGGTFTLPQSGKDKSLRISNNTTLYVYGDLEMNGNIENYGKIIVYGNIRMGRNIEGDINANKTAGELYYDWGYFKNYNLIYCTGYATFNCVNSQGSGLKRKSNGLTLQNGNHTDNDARIYVGSRLTTRAALDNFGKIYVGGDVNTTWGLEGNTKYSHWGTGLDNNTNSLLFADGSLNTHEGYNNHIAFDRPSHTVVKNNSMLYVGKDLTTSANLLVGKPKFAEVSVESGEEQYNYFSSGTYNGLDKVDPYYHVCDKNTPGAKEVDTLIPDNPLFDRYYAKNIWEMTRDQDGNKVALSFFDGDPKYVVKYDLNAYSKNNADFGFAYVKGKVLTGKSNSLVSGNIYNTVIYGKSILFVEAKDLPANVNALETGYIHVYPFARFYTGGNAYTSHNDSDFKYKWNESIRWRNQESYTNGDSVELWYYSRTWVNGSLLFNAIDFETYGGRKFVMHDTAKCFINGSCEPREYVEIGKPYRRKAIDSIDGALDAAGKHINGTEIQVNGDFTIKNPSLKNSYLTLFPRSTLNANGDVVITSIKDLTTDGIRLQHHCNLRAAGKVRAGSVNIGSCSNVNVGKDMLSLNSLHIYDKCNVNVGGNGGGDIVSYLGKIDIGQHEKENYKYNTWADNHKSQGTDFTGGNSDIAVGDTLSYEYLKEAKIECPNCGKVGSVKDGNFQLSDKPNYNGYYEFTCTFCSTKDKKTVFDETSPIFVDDGVTTGATVFVNGTIKPLFGSIHLFAKSQAYANDSVRSYRSITIDKKAGLYVTATNVGDNGILYDYYDGNNEAYTKEFKDRYIERAKDKYYSTNKQPMPQSDIDKLVINVPSPNLNQLLDADYYPIADFYVETDVNSNDFGNVYFMKTTGTDKIIIDDPDTEHAAPPAVSGPNAVNKEIPVANQKFFGFSVVQVPLSSTDDALKPDSWLGILFNPEKNSAGESYGYLAQTDNLYYYDDGGNKIYPYKAVYHQFPDPKDNSKTIWQATNCYYGLTGVSGNRNITFDQAKYDYAVSPDGSSSITSLNAATDSYVNRYIYTTITEKDADNNDVVKTVAQRIDLKPANGAVTSYGPLTVDDNANLYATGNITAYGKTFIGDNAMMYTENGNFRSLKIISLGSLIKGNSVCGLEIEHGTLYAGKNIYVLSCADIEGGAIYAKGNILFDSIYVKYLFNPSNIHTDSTKLDFYMCTEGKGANINFNSIFNVLGGFVYAPYGNLNVKGTYFEHAGAYIGEHVYINAFYIAFHRLPNVSVMDMKWANPGDVYLCEPIS